MAQIRGRVRDGRLKAGHDCRASHPETESLFGLMRLIFGDSHGSLALRANRERDHASTLATADSS
jgi:hypothetical protein